MKKLLAIVFTFALILSLTGCATFTALPEIENIPNKEVVDALPTDNTLSKEKPTEQVQLPNQPDPETQPVFPVETTQPETETKPTTPEKPTVAPDPTTPTQSEQEPVPSEGQPPAKKTKAEATAIALAHAKAAKTDVRDFEIELERDEIIPHYDISFDYNSKEYEYEIDLYSGEILKSHVEADDKNPAETPVKPTVTPDPTTPTQSEQEPVPSESQPPAKKTKSEATAIALAHAKSAKSDVRDFEIELERDERIPHYDISFDYNGKEYEYEIDLYSGEILKSHVEADDKKPAKTPVKPTQPEPEAQPVTPVEKTAVEAKAAALAHAKVQESSVRDFEVEKETERKQTFYEISFHAGGYDYEYKVDAITGKILHWEKEFDD